MAAMSAIAFGALAVLAKLAYLGGMTVAQTLSWRFIIATLGMLAVSIAVGSNPLKIRRRKLLALLVMGGGCYGLQSMLFFTALTYLPASMAELLLFIYPVFVVVGGWLLGRRIGVRIIGVLVTSLIGVALLIGGFELPGNAAVGLALAAPLAYAIYLLVAEPMMRGEGAFSAATVVMAGAALFWFGTALVRGEFAIPLRLDSWLILLGLATIPSMMAIPLLLSAIAAIGSERVALISVLEPVVTVVLALAFLGESMHWPQIVGAALVLGSIVVLQWPTREKTDLDPPLAPLNVN